MFWRLNHLVAAASMALVLCKSDCPVWTGCGAGECTAQAVLQAKIRDVFGHQSFKPGQLEALLPVAHGKDVFICMATGGGKSVHVFGATLH